MGGQLARYNPASLFTKVLKGVAPERSTAVDKVLRDHSITFRVDDKEKRIFFAAQPESKRIIVGLPCIGRLWAHAFAYIELYEALVARPAPALTSMRIDFSATPTLQKAAGLLKWATGFDIRVKLADKGGFKVKWQPMPSNVPTPFAAKKRSDAGWHADELALRALGFILHHEVAHIELQHAACVGPTSIREEKEADARAADWMLHTPTLTPLQQTGRLLGIATALGWLASLDVYLQPSTSTHPPGYDRFFQVLDQYVPDVNHAMWEFAYMLLGVHIQNRHLAFDTSRQFQSFREVADHYVDVISRIQPT